MSVSHKKINGLIEVVAAEVVTNQPDVAKEALIKLCQRVYLLESSTTQVASSVRLAEVKAEIDFFADLVFEDLA